MSVEDYLIRFSVEKSPILSAWLQWDPILDWKTKGDESNLKMDEEKWSERSEFLKKIV